MSNKIIKWGFIGCGEVTKYKSGPAFQKVEGSKVVAVMSRDGKKAKAYAKERNIPKWYDDAQELIDDPEVNAVYIATPPSSHATYAIMSMKAGKPVYIEKPMAQTYEECARINRISQETGVPCFVAYYRRYLPYFMKVKELVDKGTIGNVINVQIRFAQPPRDLDYNRENLPWRVQADIAEETVGASGRAPIFVATFQESGWLLFGVGAAITLVPMLVAVFVGLFVFKINMLDLLGTITGGMTSTPGLAAADSMTDSNIPSVAYATVYPIAMVFLILFIQIIATMF